MCVCGGGGGATISCIFSFSFEILDVSRLNWYCLTLGRIWPTHPFLRVSTSCTVITRIDEFIPFSTALTGHSSLFGTSAGSMPSSQVFFPDHCCIKM